MPVRRRFARLAVNAAAAIVGAALSLVVLRTTSLETWFGRDNGASTSLSGSVQKSMGRIASTPPSSSQHTASVAGQPLWRSSVMPGSVTGGAAAVTSPSTPPSGFLVSRNPDSADGGPWSTAVETVSNSPDTGRSSGPVTRSKQDRGPRKSSRPRKRRKSVTLKSRLAEISPGATKRLVAKFRTAKVAWPPDEIAFVAIKDEKVLELHARAKGQSWKPIHRYRVLAASGGAGPKLRQGDRQVPEGIYRIVYLNPRSAYHVSLRVNYPNKFDRRMAAKEGRKRLGGDIMIHGKRSSAGCLAVGDTSVEELFVLAAKTGYSKVKTIIAPTDFRRRGLLQSKPGQPKWLPKLYLEIAAAMAEFKVPKRKKPSLLSFFTQSQ